MENLRKALNIVSIITSTLAMILTVKSLCAKTDDVEETEE